MTDPVGGGNEKENDRVNVFAVRCAFTPARK